MAARSFEEIEPLSKWKREPDCDVLEVHLPEGVKKEHLKVQVNNLGTLTITGECPLNGNKGIRIRREIKVSKDCKTSDIRAKFSKGILRISMPKANALNQSADQGQASKEAHEDGQRNTGKHRQREDKLSLRKLNEYGKVLVKKTPVGMVAVAFIVAAAAAAIWAYNSK